MSTRRAVFVVGVDLRSIYESFWLVEVSIVVVVAVGFAYCYVEIWFVCLPMSELLVRCLRPIGSLVPMWHSFEPLLLCLILR